MNVKADRPDLRDKVYAPSLRRLPATLSHPGNLPPLRNQGSEGACTAMALANVIDIQRLADDTGAPSVSPRMLFEMAKQQQGVAPDDEPQLYSLRPIIKAFYHNGVCLEKEWPFSNGDRLLNVTRAKAARSIILGAYFRILSYLDDYHAALNETGAILVAAHVHPNWQRDKIERNKGHILPAFNDSDGAHAFVLVGYDERGFLVLNSWGEDWGGFNGQPGLAHWQYEDWADSIIDAWALRLAVSTPEAFAYTLGENGLSVSSESIGQPSVRRAMLVGHYAHLDDGRHVERGSYRSSRAVVEETAHFLAGRAKDNSGSKATDGLGAAATDIRQYSDVLLRFASSSQDLEKQISAAAKVLPLWKRSGIYPFWVFWWNDHAVQCRRVLDAIVAAAHAEVGETGRVLNTLIELRVHGLGRAVWRDIKASARRAMVDDGDGHHLVRSFVDLCAERKMRLHLLGEGEGVFPLTEFLKRAVREERSREALAACLASLRLLAPLCTVDDYRATLAPSLRKLQGESQTKPAITVYVPSRDFEARMRVGAYKGSYFQMVANAFEDCDNKGRPPRLLGASRSSSMRKDGPRGVQFQEFQPHEGPSCPLDLPDLLGDSRIREIFGISNRKNFKETTQQKRQGRVNKTLVIYGGGI